MAYFFAVKSQQRVRFVVADTAQPPHPRCVCVRKDPYFLQNPIFQGVV